MLQTVISVDPLTESNCYILAEDSKCVVIDPGESEFLLRTLDEYGWEPELILLTHEHCDHMAGLDALRETYPQARFAASKVCNDGIQNTRLNMSRIMEVYLYFRGKPCISGESRGSTTTPLSADLRMRSLRRMRICPGGATRCVWYLCPDIHPAVPVSSWMKRSFSAEIISFRMRSPCSAFPAETRTATERLRSPFCARSRQESASVPGTGSLLTCRRSKNADALFF